MSLFSGNVYDSSYETRLPKDIFILMHVNYRDPANAKDLSSDHSATVPLKLLLHINHSSVMTSTSSNLTMHTSSITHVIP